ncbi:hypothetical protein D3D03_09225 [Exiguobacterium sp. RIT452]|uniref:hypothetical protein n=1 Tax=Exiguobacterium sp. RIT452 TaxID=2315552 RepID=UPI000E7209A3|nr:hypothetical protein [Exiguobacterium sp. RIT452]RJO98917.1 hypothetical protein D3D03_09225 [Exiguobacterium sp. RIT452]
MIHELIRASDSTAIGGFIATCADPILTHVNPSQLKTKDLIANEYFSNERNYLNFIVLSK